MNKLNTPNGQMPIYLDDFRFMDDIYRSGIEAILKTFAKDVNCIVWGCEMTWHDYTTAIAEGGIWYQNEYFYCPAAICTEVQDDREINVNIVEQLTNARTMGNGDIGNAWTLRYCEFTNVENGVMSFIDLPKLVDVMASSINKTENNIGFTFLNGWLEYAPGSLVVRTILGGNFVEIKGVVKNGTFLGSEILTIGGDYAPVFAAKGIAAVDGSAHIINVDVNGRLGIEQYVASGAVIVISILYPLF